MDGSRDNRSSNEMEQIQRGLEAFLDKEIKVIDVTNRKSAAGGLQQQRGGQSERELMEWDLSREEPDAEEEEDIDMETVEGAAEGEALEGRTLGRASSAVQLYQILEEGEDDMEQGLYMEGQASEDWDSGNSIFAARRSRSSGGSSSGSRQSRLSSGSRQLRSSGGSSSGSRQLCLSGDSSSGGSSSGSRQPRSSGSASSGTRQPRPSGETSSGRRAQWEEDSVQMVSEAKASDRKSSRKASPGKKSGVDQPAEESVSGKRSAKGKTAETKPPKKKKTRWKAKLCRLLIAAVLIIALLGFGLYQLVGLVYGRMTFREIESVAGLPMKEQGVVNILLIGNDSRENGEDGRSDAMILLSISNKTKKIYMISLLRDIYVDIPGYDGNRLNAAYSFGGAELLMETIEKNFDIPVHRYMLVNFEAFAGLVDAVGGVELELTTEEVVFVNGYLSEYNRLTNRPEGTDNMDESISGLVHLNGPQALAYSRNRYIGTDFGRTERQRKVLTEVIGKLPKAVLTNAGGLIDGLMSNLTTNLTQAECFQLSLMAGKLFTYEIVSDSIPQPGTYNSVTIRNMSVLEVDFDTNVRYLKEKIYGE